jgi:hypothetical protein
LTTPATALVRMRKVYQVELPGVQMFDAPVLLDYQNGGHLRITGGLYNTNTTATATFIKLTNCGGCTIAGTTFEGYAANTADMIEIAGSSSADISITGNTAKETHRRFIHVASAATCTNLSVTGNSTSDEVSFIKQESAGCDRGAFIGHTAYGDASVGSQGMVIQGAKNTIGPNDIINFETGISIGNGTNNVIDMNNIDATSVAYTEGASASSYFGPGNNIISGTVTLAGTRLPATLREGMNIVLGTTTGTKIGTSTSQKLGFSTPRRLCSLPTRPTCGRR